MPNRNARQLRAVMTDAERRLWTVLRGRRLAGYKFRRQYPLGPFVLDFASRTGWRSRPMAGSMQTTTRIGEQGWRILRFWNNEILSNPDGVAETILRELKSTGIG